MFHLRFSQEYEANGVNVYKAQNNKYYLNRNHHGVWCRDKTIPALNR